MASAPSVYTKDNSEKDDVAMTFEGIQEFSGPNDQEALAIATSSPHQAKNKNLRPTNAKATAEMVARVRQHAVWKFKIRVLVFSILHLLTSCFKLLAILYCDREVAQAVRDWDIDGIAVGCITDGIVDRLAQTGLAVFGVNIIAKQFPDDVEETRRLYGDKAARSCWSVQKEMTRSWWELFMTTGNLDVQGLRQIPWARRAYWHYLEWQLLRTSGKLWDKWFPEKGPSKVSTAP
ncbi:hypothetical protein PRZ48_012654 [Zasmidium cellare]|uniref:Uncharacterized protein n=1 Tax=Zasmidium cellare TaxID=395010 RepID=A0ABR0E5H7_ZASCE|nr:hypothetical protein PRZ48_012654 [Zasmidium cellare]